MNPILHPAAAGVLMALQVSMEEGTLPQLAEESLEGSLLHSLHELMRVWSMHKFERWYDVSCLDEKQRAPFEMLMDKDFPIALMDEMGARLRLLRGE